MKHCKTLFVLVAAAIVMLTPGCARQTVHPVPIRYNFLDHLPDYDPMLLDTESVSGAHSAVADTAHAPVAGAVHIFPAPIRNAFKVQLTPDHDPMLLETEAVLVNNGNLLETTAMALDSNHQSMKPQVVRYRFSVDETPDHDPMLLETETILVRHGNLSEAAIAEGSNHVSLKPQPIHYRFSVAENPDHDPMLLEGMHGILSVHSGAVNYQFSVSNIPDYDPMLSNTESVAGAQPVKRDTALAVTSGQARIFR